MDKLYLKKIRKKNRKTLSFAKVHNMMNRSADISGFTDGHHKLAEITFGSGSAYVNITQRGVLSTDIGSTLACQGLPVTKKEEEEVRRRLGMVNTSAERRCAHHSGWVGVDCYVLPDHRLFPVDNPPSVTVTFKPWGGHMRTAGSRKTWRKLVAEPVAEHPLFVMALSLAFAAPLRPFCPEIGSVIVEVVARKGSGKSTLQQLAASAMGPIGVGSEGVYQTPCAAFLVDPLGLAARHADMLTIFENVDQVFAGEADSASMKQVKALLFEPTAKPGEVPAGFIIAPGAKLFALSSSVRSLAEMGDKASEIARVGAESLVSLVIGWDRSGGVFEQDLESSEDIGQFAATLTRAAAENHGTAFPAFLEKLVSDVAADREAFQQRVNKMRRIFRRRVTVDGNDGMAVRLADIFSMIYAGGALAKRYGILPKSFQIGDSVVACYHMARAGSVQRQDVRSRLDDLANDEATVRVGAEAEMLSEAERLRARVFLRERPTGRELIIPPRFIEHVFSDWPQLCAREDVRATMIKDGDQWQPKRRLWRNVKGERCFVFRLPPNTPVATGSAIDRLKSGVKRKRPTLTSAERERRRQHMEMINERKAYPN